MVLISLARNRLASSKEESRASLGPVVSSSLLPFLLLFCWPSTKWVYFLRHTNSKWYVRPGGLQGPFSRLRWNDYKKFYKGVNGEQTPFFTDSLSLGGAKSRIFGEGYSNTSVSQMMRTKINAHYWPVIVKYEIEQQIRRSNLRTHFQLE